MLAEALHAAAEQLHHVAGLFEVPGPDFDGEIVETRLEARRRHFRDQILDLIERDIVAELHCYEREWVAHRIGWEGRRP